MNRNGMFNKITTVIISLTILSCSLCACEYHDNLATARKMLEERSGRTSSAGDTSDDTSIAVYDTDGSELLTGESVIDMMETENGRSDFLSAADLVSSNARLFEDMSSEYAYSKLSDDEKTIYKEIYSVIDSLGSEVLLSTLDTEMIDFTFKAVLVDHPEIFYVTGYSLNKYMMGDKLKKITFSGTYTMSKEMVEEKNNVVDAYVMNVLSGISQNASDYDKAKYVYEYLINNTSYKTDSENNQNILSVCENGVTVCQGYAKMAELLLSRLGLFCTLVNGYAANSTFEGEDGTIYEQGESDWGTHVWNIVGVDGEFYNFDVTWGDSSFLFRNQSGDYVDGDEINYDYLLVPDSMLNSTHLAQPIVDMPACESMDANYYVREGLYFTQVDRGKIAEIFANGYANGDVYVTLKCENATIYDEMREYLFKSEGVFEYLATNNVRYVEYPDRFAFSVYL